MRYLYSALLYALLPLLLLRLLVRSVSQPAYRARLGERWGLVPPAPVAGQPVLWLHAASLGEVQAAAPLLDRLLAAYPDHVLWVTTTTPAGSRRLLELFGQRVMHSYLPWDLPGPVRRFLARARPRLLLLMETELWPNLIHCARARDCRVVVANARLSAKSARGYRRIAPLARPMLAQLDAVACQSAEVARRFESLGVAPGACAIAGSLKFDIAVDDALRARADFLCVELGLVQRTVFVAASTHPGEERAVLAAFARLRARRGDCLLLLAPRQPQRCQRIERLCRAGGWRVRRRLAGRADDCDVYLLDTLGELPLLYSVAAAAFVGGSMVPAGGHNPLEAAAWGVPVICGRHCENFAPAVALLGAAGALLTVDDTVALGDCLCALFVEPGRRAAMGAAAQRVVAENRGACAAHLALLARVLGEGAAEPTSMSRSAAAAVREKSPGASRPPD